MIYIAAPCYNGMTMHTSKALLQCGQSKHDVVIQQQDYSILCYNFNAMWCDMLNRRRKREDISHFCMIHSDICILDSENGGINWLDTFVNLLEESKSDVLSVISPLKDERGVTSTGVFDEERQAVVKRFTIRELESMPTTFELDDVTNQYKMYYHKLVVNTGLMLVKVEDWCEKVFFHDRHYILKVTDKETGVVEFIPQVISEDWMFSVDVQKLGKVVKATKGLKIEHMGKCGYRNYGAWGTLLRDDLSR